jgi:hypothetical protein
MSPSLKVAHCATMRRARREIGQTQGTTPCFRLGLFRSLFRIWDRLGLAGRPKDATRAEREVQTSSLRVLLQLTDFVNCLSQLHTTHTFHRTICTCDVVAARLSGSKMLCVRVETGYTHDSSCILACDASSSLTGRPLVSLPAASLPAASLPAASLPGLALTSPMVSLPGVSLAGPGSGPLALSGAC